jgi:hypothetical protein
MRTVEQRRAAFAAFVDRSLRNAQQGRGWSLPQVALQAGIGSNTIRRWREGSWKQGPLPDQVVAFCDVLDIPTQAAFSILWPGKSERPREPEPAAVDPDIAEVARLMNDPNVSDFDRQFIRETLKQLAARPTNRTARTRRQASAG